MSKTATLNLRIDADLKAAFSKLAEREERSTAYMVETCDARPPRLRSRPSSSD